MHRVIARVKGFYAKTIRHARSACQNASPRISQKISLRTRNESLLCGAGSPLHSVCGSTLWQLVEEPVEFVIAKERSDKESAAVSLAFAPPNVLLWLLCVCSL